MIRRRSHRKSVSRLVIKPRFPDLPLNPIIKRPSFLSLPTLSIKYPTSWAMLYGKKKPSVHPAAWSPVSPIAGFESMAREPGGEIAFPHRHLAQASSHPARALAPLLPTTLPCSLATAPLTALHGGIWTNPAGLVGLPHFIGSGLASGAGERRPWRPSPFSDATWNKWNRVTACTGWLDLIPRASAERRKKDWRWPCQGRGGPREKISTSSGRTPGAPGISNFLKI